MTPTTLTTIELKAILLAIASAMAAMADGEGMPRAAWPDDEWAALSRAEDKVRARLQRRKEGR